MRMASNSTPATRMEATSSRDRVARWSGVRSRRRPATLSNSSGMSWPSPTRPASSGAVCGSTARDTEARLSRSSRWWVPAWSVAIDIPSSVVVRSGRSGPLEITRGNLPKVSEPVEGRVALAPMGDRRRRSKEDREARREELLDAAVTAIRREGADVSMDDIASEAGITKPILYSNFGDKAGLADALATRFTHDLIALFGAVWAETDDPRERVARSIDAWVGFIESDPHIYQFLSEGSFGAGRRLDDRRLVSDLGTVVARALGEWLREQGADSGPAEPWAFGVLGMVHVTTEWWLERRTLSRKDLVQYLTSLLWTGFSGNGLDDTATTRGAAPATPTEDSGDERPTATRSPSSTRRRTPRRSGLG